VYGGDIWISSKEGGTAIQLTHSPGEESWPRFSSDILVYNLEKDLVENITNNTATDGRPVPWAC